MEIHYYLPFFILLLILLSLWIHGVIIMRELHGYRRNPKVKGHPEMIGCKKGDLLMVVKFTDDDYQELMGKVQRQKMEELFEEPSSYEDELDDDSWNESNN